MILQAVPRTGAGYGGILLLCLIILVIFIVIKLIQNTTHKQPISKHLSNEEKQVKNNLYRADNNVKLCKQDNLEIEAFHIDDCINNKTREVSELDQTILNIIRVGANQTDILAAYKARKKSIQLLEQQTSRVDCESYVDALMLDFYPNEFKKAEQEKKFFIYLFCLVLFIVPSFVCGYITLEKLICYNFDLDVVYIWDSLPIFVFCGIISLYFGRKILNINQLKGE